MGEKYRYHRYLITFHYSPRNNVKHHSYSNKNVINIKTDDYDPYYPRYGGGSSSFLKVDRQEMRDEGDVTCSKTGVHCIYGMHS